MTLIDEIVSANFWAKPCVHLTNEQSSEPLASKPRSWSKGTSICVKHLSLVPTEDPSLQYQVDWENCCLFIWTTLYTLFLKSRPVYTWKYLKY